VSDAKGIMTSGTVTITLAQGANITTKSYGIDAGTSMNLTLNTGSEIVSTTKWALRGGTGADVIDSSGLIQGTGGQSMFLWAGNDSLTLRTGSDIVGFADGGANTDTLTLIGTNSEDAQFVNFETVDMNGTDWTLSGTSSFTDIKVNTGKFTSGGA